MDLELCCSTMECTTKDNGKMIPFMAMAKSFIQMEIFSKVIGKMDYHMDLDCMSPETQFGDMRVIGKKESKVEKAKKFLKMDLLIRDIF